MKQNILIFDVKSTSLNGAAFAVGALVVTKDGKEIDRFELLSKEGAANANSWVKYKVLPFLSDMPTCDTDKELREEFFDFYMKYRNISEIWADVCFPVETNFLTAIVADDIEWRPWLMPYPLRDVSTIVDTSIDRHAECGIIGLREHHPIDDCRASLSILFKSLVTQSIYNQI